MLHALPFPLFVLLIMACGESSETEPTVDNSKPEMGVLSFAGQERNPETGLFRSLGTDAKAAAAAAYDPPEIKHRQFEPAPPRATATAVPVWASDFVREQVDEILRADPGRSDKRLGIECYREKPEVRQAECADLVLYRGLFVPEMMEPTDGFEPSTCGLRNRCFTTELRWRKPPLDENGIRTPWIIAPSILTIGCQDQML
jgi:hypothetical protein